MRLYLLAAFALIAACSNEASNQEARDNQIKDAEVRDPTAPVPRGFETDNQDLPSTPVDDQARQAARQTLQHYFAMVQAGRTDDASNLWLDRNRGTAFTARIQRLGDFQPSIAAPSYGESSKGFAEIEISFQLLQDTSSGLVSLLDGTASLQRANDETDVPSASVIWRIDSIALQPPPVLLDS